MSKKLTQSEFIAKAVAVHGKGRYDYSQVVYRSGRSKVIIGCLRHGNFEQAPIDHARGQGCSLCGNLRIGQALASDLELFVQKSRAVHGNTYDYSQVVYANNRKSIKIVCPQHGVFVQSPSNHLAGKGCRKCGRVVFSQKLALSRDEFIDRAFQQHGNKYDYSAAVVASSKSKVLIRCLTHGPFEQQLGSHLSGAGCPSCAAERQRLSWIEQAKGHLTTLYLLRVFGPDDSYYKIGITYRTVRLRYKGKLPPGYSYEILAQHSSTSAARTYDWEKSILSTFAHLRYRPKRRFEGETECFASCEEILDIFPL